MLSKFYTIAYAARLGLLVILILLLMELAFRTYYFGTTALWQPWIYSNRGLIFSNLVQEVEQNDICYKLQANLNTYFRGKKFSTNQYGFRDLNNFSPQKPANSIRIAVLGRSVSMGSGVDDEQVYSQQLQQILREKLPNYNIEILNFSVGGYRYRQVASAYEHYVTKFAPDIILWPVYYGELQRFDPMCLGPQQVRPKWDNLRAYLMDFFVNRGLESLLEPLITANLAPDWHGRGRSVPVSAPLASYSEILTNFIANRRAEGITVILVALPLPPVTTLQVPVAQYPLAQAELTTWVGNNVYLIDTGIQLATQITASDAIYLGDFHPNAAVHKLYAEHIAPELINIMRKLFFTL